MRVENGVIVLAPAGAAREGWGALPEAGARQVAGILQEMFAYGD